MTPLGFSAAVLVRWLALGALAALIGSLVLERWILDPAQLGLDPASRRLHRSTGVWTVVVIVATLAELVIRTQTMTRAGLGVTVSAIPTVLWQTHFGSIWIARLALLVLVLGLSRLASETPRRALLPLVLGVAATTSLTGHAADWGDLTASVLVDWIHVLAAGAWAGGLIALASLVSTAGYSWPPEVLARTARRFSRLATVCLLGVVLSGVYNASMQVATVATLWETSYGRVLVVKGILVVALVWLGAVNRWSIVPRLGPGRPAGGVGFRLVRVGRLVLRGPRRTAPRRAPARFTRYVGYEAILAVLVFAGSAALGESTPARHAAHGRHAAVAEAERGPFRVTMEQLHESGGVPRGWTFRPPAGDAGRGRTVFARLECFRCHAVAGEDFPAPMGAGPDLTGMGAHHPAGYLAESVMNPNAVIVEGPGYTGPDGRSTMPDYRDTLSVGDLTDLVAYLETLRSAEGGDR